MLTTSGCTSQIEVVSDPRVLMPVNIERLGARIEPLVTERVSQQASGRELSGVVWDQYP